MKVNIREIQRLLNREDQVNGVPLEAIEFVDDDDNRVEVSQKAIEHWRFVGLSNVCFIETILLGRGSITTITVEK